MGSHGNVHSEGAAAAAEVGDYGELICVRFDSPLSQLPLLIKVWYCEKLTIFLSQPPQT